MKKKEFDAIGKAIVANTDRFREIYLDVFGEEEYIVVEFRSGAISVRTANLNNTIANIQELSRLLNGGYYKEVEEYKATKEKFEKEYYKRKIMGEKK